MRAIITLILLATLHANGEPAQLAREGRALFAVVIGEKAPESTRTAAAELAEYLNKITVAGFVVEPGDGARGIVFGVAADFARLPFAVEFGTGPFACEDYILRSTTDGVWLIGASAMAARHAGWDLLHRLGYRQFFPGETGEVLPSIRDPAIDVAAKESPSFTRAGVPAGHRRFRTLILQSENGTLRLKEEFAELPEEIEEFVLNSKDTEFAFHDPEFRDELRALIAKHQPDVVIIDRGAML